MQFPDSAEKLLDPTGKAADGAGQLSRAIRTRPRAASTRPRSTSTRPRAASTRPGAARTGVHRTHLNLDRLNQAHLNLRQGVLGSNARGAPVWPRWTSLADRLLRAERQTGKRAVWSSVGPGLPLARGPTGRFSIGAARPGHPYRRGVAVDWNANRPTRARTVRMGDSGIFVPPRVGG